MEKIELEWVVFERHDLEGLHWKELNGEKNRLNQKYLDFNELDWEGEDFKGMVMKGLQKKRLNKKGK